MSFQEGEPQQKLQFVPRGEPFQLPRACECGNTWYVHVTTTKRGSHPMISIRRAWFKQCVRCKLISDYEPSPDDIARNARKTS